MAGLLGQQQYGLLGAPMSQGLLGRDPMNPYAPPEGGEVYWTPEQGQTTTDRVAGGLAMMPYGMAGAAWDAVTAPGRAYQEGMTQDEMIQRSADLAGILGLGGAGWAKAAGQSHTLGSAGGRVPQAPADLPMDYASRMARAEEMGFDTSTPLYVSTLDDISEFAPHGKFAGHKGVSGVSLTDNPELASRYLERYGDYRYDGKTFQKGVMPVYIKKGNVLEAGQSPYRSPVPMGHPLPDDYVNPMIADGVDTLIVPDAVSRRGGVKHSDAKNAIRGNEYIVADPSQIRSTAAKFDPAQSSSPNLLAANNPDAPPIGAAIVAGHGDTPPPGIKAYHGSPHDDKSSGMKIAERFRAKLEGRPSWEREVEMQRELAGLRAAVKDTETGKVYTGSSHQGAIDKIPPTDETGAWGRLQHAWNEEYDNIGFVDQDGNFISRSEADEAFSILTVEDLRDLRNNKTTMRKILDKKYAPREATESFNKAYLTGDAT